MRLQTCETCGISSVNSRCPKHARGPRPRGNAFEPTRQAVATRDGWVCQLCYEPIDPTLRKPDPMALHLDHVARRADGGADHPSNYRATHADCNLRRKRGDR